MTNNFKVIGVVGAGLMGSGIAAVCTLAGMRTTVVDTDCKRLAGIKQFVDDVDSELREAGFVQRGITSPIVVSTDVDALSDASFVFEAVPERLDQKHRVYAELERRVSPHAVIASTTSSFVPADLALHLHRPERFSGRPLLESAPRYRLSRSRSGDADERGRHRTDCYASCARFHNIL